MRFLTTGDGGFLAGHISACLQTIADLEVRGLRRVECGRATDLQRLSAVQRSFKPAVVFDLAGRISGSEFELDRDNRLVTANLQASLLHECPSARVVLGSAAAVYARVGPLRVRSWSRIERVRAVRWHQQVWRAGKPAPIRKAEARLSPPA